MNPPEGEELFPQALADAPSPWISIPGLLILSAVFVAVSAWRIRGMEVSYEEE